ncbi:MULTISPECIES: hypothetical protein [unclassified Arthrobacter]|uniref:hypothetical protein n=1 Tax=unclassified Arthrobacter TaxID=235627 RepID=UPI001D1491D3|nr:MULTISPECIES: hypothetical protein [unclassified Arthrobacter]MCC3289719.1 hypothetical protein [Arthrobacter sp. zg-Y1110]MCC3300765.1 hypothetical protein [Arthrobacter sp. zg-Y895]MCC9173903.1 hypothetical protein [Arthrobacter sp. zg-Y179]MCQ1946157.1 hypothetical protein [Arthrobacter sp. zg-Y1116]MCQ1986095.1 hypothetical protein [Arthrobacter sp. zg-Y844]
MSATRWCLLIGLVLGIVLAFGGWLAFLITLLFGLIGLLVGLVADGKVDVAGMLGKASSR